MFSFLLKHTRVRISPFSFLILLNFFMGLFKRTYSQLNNKKCYARVKFYKFYRKDFWGLIRIKRQYINKKLKKK